jgi:hypothetical protein
MYRYVLFFSCSYGSAEVVTGAMLPRHTTQNTHVTCHMSTVSVPRPTHRSRRPVHVFRRPIVPGEGFVFTNFLYTKASPRGSRIPSRKCRLGTADLGNAGLPIWMSSKCDCIA